MEQCIGKKTSRRFLQDYLRLIDVKNMVIVRSSSSRTEYVALTYVWGEDKLKRERPLGWEMPRTLSAAVCTDEYGVETIDLPEELPRTVRDAIAVTRSLGYGYLWVDSLCIIQDDKQDKDLQIGMMDEIYSNATLTIAAGSGLRKSIELLLDVLLSGKYGNADSTFPLDADWGLPGISRRRRYAQRSEIVDGVELAVELPSFENLNSGTSLVWNTRGWTLQEKVCSLALLVSHVYLYLPKIIPCLNLGRRG
jgi:hypothetical protein